MDLFKKVKEWHSKVCPLKGTKYCPANWKKKYKVFGIFVLAVLVLSIFN